MVPLDIFNKTIPTDGISYDMYLLILSNLCFLLPVYSGYKKGHKKESLLLLTSALFSILYHSCDCMVKLSTPIKSKREYVCWNVSYGFFQFLDFFYARICISILCMKLCKIPFNHKEWLYHIYYGTVLILTLYDRFSEWGTGFLVVNDLLLPGICTIRSVYSWLCGKDLIIYILHPDVSKLNFIMSCSFFTIGIISLEISTDKTYNITHSLWHIAMSISSYFVLRNQIAEYHFIGRDTEDQNYSSFS